MAKRKQYLISSALLDDLIYSAGAALTWARRDEADDARRVYDAARALRAGPPAPSAASAAGAALRAIPSADRAQASRANGKRGGRPRKAPAPGLIVLQPDGNRDANADGVELDGNPPRPRAPRPASMRPADVDIMAIEYGLDSDDVDKVEAEYAERHGRAPATIQEWAQALDNERVWRMLPRRPPSP